MSDFVIEKDIPFPSTRGGRPILYRWEELEIGDSVLVGSSDTANRAREWARRHHRRFVYKKMTEGKRGWRIWRME